MQSETSIPRDTPQAGRLKSLPCGPGPVGVGSLKHRLLGCPSPRYLKMAGGGELTTSASGTCSLTAKRIRGDLRHQVTDCKEHLGESQRGHGLGRQAGRKTAMADLLFLSDGPPS